MTSRPTSRLSYCGLLPLGASRQASCAAVHSPQPPGCSGTEMPMSHVDAVHAPLAGGECRGTTAASSVNGSERPNADVGGVLVAGTGCGAGAGVNANAYDSYYYELSWLGGDGPCGYRRHAIVRTRIARR